MRKRLAFLVATALVFLLPCWVMADTQVSALKEELSEINQDIEEAEAKDATLAGGLVKGLLQARIELLKTNAALVQQRMHAIESGAKITIRVTGTKPDPKRAARLKKEIGSLEGEIAAKESESARYRGGLVKAMAESTIGTMHNSKAMLQAEYLKAKYGIYWLPSLKQGETIGAGVGPQNESRVSSLEARGRAKEPRAQLVVPTLTNKRFQESDFRRRIYEDAIWFDVSWDTSNLNKPTRAVKGILVIGDIFGEPKLRLRRTINDTLTPGQEHTETGVGFEYNQFKSEHKWVRSTDLKDMTFRFEVTDVIYQDGAAERF